MGVNCSNLTYVDPSLDEYVWKNMGPRCVGRSFATAAMTIYGLILLLGLFGNMSTCLVIVRNKGMHTATNYYLFSLAISDVLMLVLGLPFEMHAVAASQYPYEMPPFICMMRAFLTEFSSYASILCITTFSAERWLAICFPLKAQLFSKFSRAVKLIALGWAVAFVCALPIGLLVKVNRLGIPENYTDTTDSAADLRDDGTTVAMTEFCALDHNSPKASSMVLNGSFYAFFVAPMLIITVLYVNIAVKLRIADRYLRARTTSVREKRTVNTRKSVLKMLIAVVIAFFVCWLPFHIQRLSTIYVDWNNLDLQTHNFFMTFYSISGFFYYANSAVNPLIYNTVSRKFRAAFVRTILPRRFQGFFKIPTDYDSQIRSTLHVNAIGRTSVSGGRRIARPTSMPLSAIQSVTDAHLCAASADEQHSLSIAGMRSVVTSPGEPPTEQSTALTGRTATFSGHMPPQNVARTSTKRPTDRRRRSRSFLTPLRPTRLPPTLRVPPTTRRTSTESGDDQQQLATETPTNSARPATLVMVTINSAPKEHNSHIYHC